MCFESWKCVKIRLRPGLPSPPSWIDLEGGRKGTGRGEGKRRKGRKREEIGGESRTPKQKSWLWPCECRYSDTSWQILPSKVNIVWISAAVLAFPMGAKVKKNRDLMWGNLDHFLKQCDLYPNQPSVSNGILICPAIWSSVLPINQRYQSLYVCLPVYVWMCLCLFAFSVVSSLSCLSVCLSALIIIVLHVLHNEATGFDGYGSSGSLPHCLY